MLRMLLTGIILLALVGVGMAGGCEPATDTGDNKEPRGRPAAPPDLPGDTCDQSTPDPEPGEQPAEPATLAGFEIGVYEGKGTCPTGLAAAGNFLDHYEVSWAGFGADLEDLDRFDLVWFPGGFSAEYRWGIQRHDRLQDFVAGGGRFIGTCAGAYYASATVAWEDGETDYPLRLFAGRAVGPIDRFYWGQPVTLTLDPDHPVNRNSLSLDTYYMDGPYFEPATDQAVTVVARYEPGGEPAVIAFDYGDGRVLLLGPHPEFGYSDQAGDYTVDGEGAAWDWLFAAVRWLLEQPSGG